jgi:hypothetical protein
MCFDGAPGNEEYPADLYRGFLEYLRREHEGEFWSPLPAEMARFWRETVRSDAVIRRERSDRGRLSRASS